MISDLDIIYDIDKKIQSLLGGDNSISIDDLEKIISDGRKVRLSESQQKTIIFMVVRKLIILGNQKDMSDRDIEAEVMNLQISDKIINEVKSFLRAIRN